MIFSYHKKYNLLKSAFGAGNAKIWQMKNAEKYLCEIENKYMLIAIHSLNGITKCAFWRVSDSYILFAIVLIVGAPKEVSVERGTR